MGITSFGSTNHTGLIEPFVDRIRKALLNLGTDKQGSLSNSPLPTGSSLIDIRGSPSVPRATAGNPGIPGFQPSPIMILAQRSGGRRRLRVP